MKPPRLHPRRDVEFPYPDDEFPVELEAIVQKTIIREGATVLAVIHDDDGDWLLADGVNDPNMPEACTLHSLSELANQDRTLRELVVMAPGFAAYRSHLDDPWSYESFNFGETPLD